MENRPPVKSSVLTVFRPERRSHLSLPTIEYPLNEGQFVKEINRLGTESHFLPGGVVKEILSSLKHEGLLKATYQETMQLLFTDLKEAFTRESDLGILKDIIDLNIDGERHGLKVEWNSKVAEEKCAGGLYFPKERKIAIKSPNSNENGALYSLATSGKLPGALKTYAHEMAHHRQYFKVNSFGVERRVAHRMQSEPLEAQAYLISDFDLANEAIVDAVMNAKDKKGEPLYPDVIQERLESVLYGFRFLNNTFASQEEIAKLVRDPGGWDDYKGAFRNVADKVNEVKYEQNIDEAKADRLGRLRKKYHELRIKSSVSHALVNADVERYKKSGANKKYLFGNRG